MTLVDLSVLHTVLGGHSPVTRGTVTVLYVVGTRPFTDLVGEEVRFSTPMVLPVTGAPLVADLAPTRGRCAAKFVVEDHVSGRTLIRHVEIPDVPTISFGELVDVNPDTFEPSQEGQAAWDAAVAAAQAAVAGAMAAKDAARTSAEAAGEAGDAAVTAAGGAVPAASSAVTAATDAALARDNAQTAAGDAVAAAAALSGAVGDVDELKTLTTTGRLGEEQLSDRFGAVAMANPDSALAGATDERIDEKLAAYSPSSAVPIQVFVGDAIDAPRPDWAGPVNWLITVDTRPTNFRSNPPAGISPDTWSFVEPEPIVPVLVWSDNFNRADVNPLTGPVGGSGALMWQATGTWLIASNQAGPANASGVKYLVADAGQADGTVKAKIVTQGSHTAGLAFRYVDANNQIVLTARVSGSDFQYRIVKRVAGTSTQIAALGVLSADGDELEVTMSGTTITVKINGSVAWTGTITDLATATAHGIYHGTATDATTRLDDASFWTLGY